MDSATLIKGVINTITRISPISLYMGCIVSGLVFNNQKANYILIGFFFVEMISLGYFYFNNGVNNPYCALFKSGDKNFIMPSPIPTSIGFFVGFQMADMFEMDKFQPGKFYSSVLFLFMVIWSRINVGCHSIVESMFSALIGLVFGVGYFYLIKDYYRVAKTGETDQINDSTSTENESINDALLN